MKNIKNFKTVKEINLPRVHLLSDGIVRVLCDETNDKYYIERIVKRNKVRNIVDKYELVKPDGTIELKNLNQEICDKILSRIESSKFSYNSCFIFEEKKMNSVYSINWTKSEDEHKYTSTGIKFWRHQEQMFEFIKPLDGSSRKTVISTHISPEGACNLKCPYCSVTYRDTHSRIPLPRIKKYVEDLMERGLKAVILTGGGEPTLYPHFNELVQWIKKEKGLSVALITNGTTSSKIDAETLYCFSWIRVSINVFPGWENKISLRKQDLNEECIVGCSMVYTSEHEAGLDLSRGDTLDKVSQVADSCNAKYIRLLPNCLLEQDQLVQQHISLKQLLENIKDKRFFQQYKVHGTPKSNICHQAYFRPYLSEEPYAGDGQPGTVYPCDSVVLNNAVTHFAKEYQLCKPEDILEFIDGKITQRFDPKQACKGCVFTDNVNMLEDWKTSGVDRFSEFKDRIVHEEFV